jgi:hypothetical protein
MTRSWCIVNTDDHYYEPTAIWRLNIEPLLTATIMLYTIYIHSRNGGYGYASGYVFNKQEHGQLHGYIPYLQKLVGYVPWIHHNSRKPIMVVSLVVVSWSQDRSDELFYLEGLEHRLATHLHERLTNFVWRLGFAVTYAAMLRCMGRQGVSIRNDSTGSRVNG